MTKETNHRPDCNYYTEVVRSGYVCTCGAEQAPSKEKVLASVDAGTAAFKKHFKREPKETEDFVFVDGYATAIRDASTTEPSPAHPEDCRCVGSVGPNPACRVHGSAQPINHDLWRHLHDEHGLTLVQSELDEIVRLAQPPVHVREMAPPYWTRTFWSPCRRYLVTAHSCQGSLTVQDDDGREWEPTGDEKNINAGIPARAVPTKPASRLHIDPDRPGHEVSVCTRCHMPDCECPSQGE